MLSDGATGQGVLQHVKINTLGSRIDAQLVQLLDGEATVLGQSQGLGLGNLRCHVRDDCRLLVAIETQGLLLT